MVSVLEVMRETTVWKLQTLAEQETSMLVLTSIEEV